MISTAKLPGARLAATARAAVAKPRHHHVRLVGDLDEQAAAELGGLRGGGGPLEHAAVDDDEVVADALELAKQVARHHDGDAEVGADPAIRPSISSRPAGSRPLVGSSRNTSLGIVHERLRELHALLHARRVAADGAVALLVEPDVAQRVRGALAGAARGQPDMRAMCTRNSVAETSSGRHSLSGM